VLSALLSKCDYFPSLPSAVVNVRPHREAATTDMSMDEPRWTTLSSGDTAVLSCCTYSSRRRAVKFKLSGVKLASNAVAKVCLPAASRWHYAHLALGCGHSPRRNGIWERKVVIGHQPGHTPAGSSTLDPGWVDYKSGGSMHSPRSSRARVYRKRRPQNVCMRLIAGSPRPDRTIPPCVLPHEACRFDLPRIARDEHPLERSMLAIRFG
jgi:hypothetical protein